jgi:hypothetical protein
MNDERFHSETRHRRALSQGDREGGGQLNAAAEYPPKCGWHCFDVAVYEYAQECAFMEFEREGYVGPSAGDVQLAYEYMPSFFNSLDEAILSSLALDRDYYALAEAQYRFVMLFRSAWGVVSEMAREEFG